MGNWGNRYNFNQRGRYKSKKRGIIPESKFLIGPGEKFMKTFENWKEEVDGTLETVSGLTSDDLADQPFREWYEGEMNPLEAAARTLQDNDFPLIDIAPHLLEYL